MRKIDTRYDDALAFLIRYNQTVVADDLDPDEISAVRRELADDAGLLKKVVDVMERQDHEIRMILVRRSPYKSIVKPGVEKIANMTIEESFLDELRHLEVDDISESMNSDIQEARHQVENFVNSRMRRLFPDMSPDETAEIPQRSAEIIDEIVQQDLDNPRAEEKEKRPRVSDVNKPKQ